MYLVTLGPPEPDTGSPKNHVLAISSLNGELVKDAPATTEVSAAKPRTAGCQRKAQPSKGPGVKRPSGVYRCSRSCTPDSKRVATRS